MFVQFATCWPFVMRSYALASQISTTQWLDCKRGCHVISLQNGYPRAASKLYFNKALGWVRIKFQRNGSVHFAIDSGLPITIFQAGTAKRHLHPQFRGTPCEMLSDGLASAVFGSVLCWLEWPHGAKIVAQHLTYLEQSLPMAVEGWEVVIHHQWAIRRETLSHCLR